MEAAWNRYFAFGNLEFPEEMTAVILCREMGWTWQELESQPLWLVKNLVNYLTAESEHVKKQKK